MNQAEPAVTNAESGKQRTWRDKFRSALRGVWLGVKGPRSFESSSGAPPSVAGSKSPNSFWVHFPAAVAAILTGLVLNISLASMGLLLLSIGLVVVAELLNTSIEFLASAVTSKHDQRIEAALDVASGAVLVASLIAVMVGGLVLGCGLFAMLV